MILSDKGIRQELASWRLKITSKYNDIDKNIWPASYDFRLWNVIKRYKDELLEIKVDEQVDREMIETLEMQDDEYLLLMPWDFVLFSTAEYIEVPDDIVIRCEGRSSIWRLWVIIHATAWYIDPWFHWTVTLEVKNLNNIPVQLKIWMRIGQFSFYKTDQASEVPYNKRTWSKYNWQISPEESRIYLDK